MSTLERAIVLAATVHAGQKDKAGAVYILHPLRLMMKMTLESQIVAMLNDVLEDCGVTPEWLAYEGFAVSVVDAVMALTKRHVDGVEEPCADFIDRAAQNPIARLVKRADLEDNRDLSRIPHPTAKDHARVQKYPAAKWVIEKATAGS